MKKLRAFIYILLFLIGATLLVLLLSNLINSRLDNLPASSENSPTSNGNQENAEVQQTGFLDSENDQNVRGENQAEVAVVKMSPLNHSYYQTLGTVKSAGVISLFPQTSAVIQTVKFREGDFVNVGDTIVTLGGANLAEHPAETQYKIAQTNLDNARDALSNLQKTTKESLKAAELQLQSAINQATAIAYDLAIIEQNRAGLDESLNILKDSLSATTRKTARDNFKAHSDIDDLIFTLNAAQDDRYRTQRIINDLEDQLKNSEDAASLEEQLGKLRTALDAQDKGIEELYKAIDQAKYGYNTAQDGAELGLNQLFGQIQQTQTQAQVLDLTLQSTKTKLGYSGETSDALQLAQQAYNSTKIQLQSALDNAVNQVKLAELNAGLAKTQLDALQIKAPLAGILTALDLNPGELVNPQTSVAEIINPKSFQLEVFVDPAVADRLSSGAFAEIILGGRALEIPVKSVSPKIDEKTKLVKVVLTLPNIFFKINQTFQVRLPLALGNASSGSTFLPLDSVIIGTQDQFVFIHENGLAKKINVKIGEIAGDQVEILEGLPANAEVIITGAKELVDGQKIKVI